MVDNVFKQRPSLRPLSASPSTTSPTLQPPEAKTDPKSQMEGLSHQTGVPVNVLMSLSEAAQAKDAGEAYQIAAAAAAKLAPAMKAGKTAKDALSEVLGPDSAPQVDKIMGRAWDIAGQLYPDRVKPKAAPDDGNLIADTAVQVAQGAVSGVGLAATGLGDVAAKAFDEKMAPINTAAQFIYGRDAIPKMPNFMKGIGDAIEKWGQDTIAPMLSNEAKAKMAGSQFSGNLLQPSTWEFGDDPSVQGVYMQAVNTFGQMLPIIAAAYATRGRSVAPLITGAIGGAQTAGDAANTAEQYIDEAANATGSSGRSVLEEQSGLYRSFLAQGMSPADALAMTKQEARKTAAVITAPIGALGGVLTGKIVNPAEHLIAQGMGRAGQIAGRAGLGFLEEGAQEAMEKTSANVSTRMKTGLQIDPTRDTLADFIMGGLAGGASGAAAGVFAKGRAPSTEQSQEQDGPDLTEPTDPDALGLPAPGAPSGPGPGAGPAGAGPSGPFSRAQRAAPQTPFASATPGQRFKINPGRGEAPFEAEFVGETPHGATFREPDSGNEFTVPHAEFANGSTTFDPINPTPPPGAAPGAGPTTPPPGAAPGAGPATPPPGAAPGAGPTTPPPGAGPTTPPGGFKRPTAKNGAFPPGTLNFKPFKNVNGKPYETAKQAAKAAMARLGHNQFNIVAINGGFAVAPSEAGMRAAEERANAEAGAAQPTAEPVSNPDKFASAEPARPSAPDTSTATAQSAPKSDDFAGQNHQAQQPAPTDDEIDAALDAAWDAQEARPSEPQPQDAGQTTAPLPSDPAPAPGVSAGPSASVDQGQPGRAPEGEGDKGAPAPVALKGAEAQPSGMSEPLKAEMRKIDGEVSALHPRPAKNGAVDAGSTGERAAQQASAGETFLRNIRAGEPFWKAAQRARNDAITAIQKHNRRRKGDVNWQIALTAHDAFIAGLARRIGRITNEGKGAEAEDRTGMRLEWWKEIWGNFQKGAEKDPSSQTPDRIALAKRLLALNGEQWEAIALAHEFDLRPAETEDIEGINRFLDKRFGADWPKEAKAEAQPEEAPAPAKGSAPDTEKPAPSAPSAEGPEGKPYRLDLALTEKERRTLGTYRQSRMGELVAQIDNAARRAEAQLRHKGGNIFAHDDEGRGPDGQINQEAMLVREAEQLTRNLIEAARAAKTGDLPEPEWDEDTGEYENDGSPMGEAIAWLENFEAMGVHTDTTDAEANGPYDASAELDYMAPEKVFPPVEKSKNIDLAADKEGLITQEEADERLAFWKKTAADIGKSKKNKGKVIISLFDYSGQWSQPWVDAGYSVIRHDIKSGSNLMLDAWIWEQLEEARKSGLEVYGVLSACPCTTFTGSGARWWASRHDLEDPAALALVFGPDAHLTGAKSALEYNVKLVQATRDIIAAANPTAFHVLENPVGRIQEAAGMPEPLARFQPSNFGDPYTKRTQLFGTFNTDLPTANVEPIEGSKIQSKLRGTDPLGKEARSTTPWGFSYAFFMANDPEAREAMAAQKAAPKAPTEAEAPGSSPSRAIEADDAVSFTEALTDKAAADRAVRLPSGVTYFVTYIGESAWGVIVRKDGVIQRVLGEAADKLTRPQAVERAVMDAFPTEPQAQPEKAPATDAEPAVGDSWEAADSSGKSVKVSIVGKEVRARDGQTVYLVQEEGERTADILTAAEVQQRKRRDEANAVSRRKDADRAEAERAAAEAAAADKANLDGFTDAMSPMQRGRVEETLSKRVMYRGKEISRRDLIRQKVAEGARMDTAGGEPVLMGKDGAFLDASALTGTGLKYAQHLIDKQDRPAAETAQPADLGGEYRGIAHPEAKAAWEAMDVPERMEALRPTIKPRAGMTPEQIETSLRSLARRAWSEMEALIGKPGWDAILSAVTNAQKPQAGPVPSAEQIAAAAAQANPEPTPAQAEAGNYQKGHESWNGLDLTIENAKGSTRRKVREDGSIAWEVEMPAHYGYFKGTEGADGDHLDFYMGDKTDSDFVLVVDQKDAETGEFDEHKVMVGFPNGKAARKAYVAGFSDGKGEDRIGGVKTMTVAELKEWIASGDTKKPLSDKMQGTKTRAPRGSRKRLEDAGAKMGGARKDTAQRYLRELSDRDLADKTLSELIPAPDYEQLAAAGVAKEALAAAALVRAMIGDKPTKRHWAYSGALERWANQMRDGAATIARLIDGDMDPNAIPMPYGRDYYRAPALAALAAFDPADFHIVSGIIGEWMHGHDINHWFNREPESLERILRAKLNYEREKIADRRAKVGKPYNFDFHIRTAKNGSASYVYARHPRVTKIEAYVNADEARAALDDPESRAELQAKAENMRRKDKERLANMRPRVGKDWRNGRDIAPQELIDTFGLRGADFGNYVQADKQQAFVNETYDSLMNLAAAIGVPPKALGLGGFVGIGFGTRGQGGWAAAHWDPMNEVINLTRDNGAGALAHEWTHALDNWLGRKFVADHKGSYLSGISAYSRPTDNAHADMIAAARSLLSVIRGSKYAGRMGVKDAMRDAPYWSTPIEMLARVFETLVIEQLEGRDMVDDFLSNPNRHAEVYPNPVDLMDMRGPWRKLLAEVAKLAEQGNVPDIGSIKEGFPGSPIAIGQKWEDANGSPVEILRKGKLEGTHDVRIGDVTRMMDDEAIMESRDEATFFKTPEGMKIMADRLAARKKAEDRAARLAEERAYQGGVVDAFIAETGREKQAIQVHDALMTFNATIGRTVAGNVLFALDKGAVWDAARSFLIDSDRRIYANRRDAANPIVKAFIEWAVKRGEPPAAAEAAADSAFGKQSTAPDDAAIDAALDAAWDEQEAAAPDEAQPAPEPAPEEPQAQPEEAPATEDTKPRQRTAGEAAKSALKNIGMGAAEIAKGLNALFDPNKLSSNPMFDPELYAKARPFFAAALRLFGNAAMDLADMARAMVAGLREQGLTREAESQMRPVLRAYLKGVMAGTENPWDETVTDAADSDTLTTDDTAPQEQGDERADLDADLSGQLEGSEPGSVPGDGPGVSDEGSAGLGESGNVGGEGGDLAGPDLGGSLVGGGGSVPGATNPVAGGLNKLSGENPGNFTITDDFGLGDGTEGEKLRGNIAAIRLVKALVAEGRFPTKEEQAVLARYVGWGGLKKAFDPDQANATGQWGNAYRALKELLTAEEYRAARSSTLNAHYTAPGIVKAMWGMMRHFGFVGGRALEPTVGTGNFLGLQPADLMASTEWHAAELDSMTGLIAKFLYPTASVIAGQGFQAVPFANGAFDIAIGNPPFGGETIRAGVHKDLRGMKVHNYIIAKTGKHLRPGGIMAMVITHRFLDTANPEARAKLAQDFRMIGAIRLPNDAFLKNANTSVVTDIVIFQKLMPGEKPDTKAAWLDTEGSIPGEGAPIRVNRYFQENPHHILGRSAMDGSMYATAATEGEYTVHSDGRDLSAAIATIMAADWAEHANALGAKAGGRSEAVGTEDVMNLAVGGMTIQDGEIYRRNLDKNGAPDIERVTADSFVKPIGRNWTKIAELARRAKALVDSRKDGLTDLLGDFMAADAAGPILLTDKGELRKGKKTQAEQFVSDLADVLRKGDRAKARDLDWKDGFEKIERSIRTAKLGEKVKPLTAMLELRRLNLALIQAEANDAPNIEALRTATNKAYDAFVEAYGPLNRPVNAKLLTNDTGAPLGLESEYRAAEDDKPEVVKKAAILSRRVVFPYVSPTKAESAQDAYAISLQERGKIDFPLMANLTGKTIAELKDELSTGEKPAIFFDPEADEYVDAADYLSGNVKAKAAAAERAGLDRNAAALRLVFPADKARHQITPSIRSQWIPTEVFEEYLTRLGVTNPEVMFLGATGMAQIDGIPMGAGTGNATADQFAHPKKSVIDIFRAAVTAKPITVYETIDSKTRVKDEEATKEVNALVSLMSSDFMAWAYSDEERAEKIVEAYNRTMNVYAQRAYDGQTYLRTKGANPAISLRTTQKNAALRMIVRRNTLVHHVVGAGKTFTAITAIMERRRMGLSKKPLVVVPNHLVTQWALDFYKLYPGARVLAATEADFEKDNRRVLFARMASGDFDAIVIGHSSLKYLPNDPETQREVINEQMEELENAIREAQKSAQAQKGGKKGSREVKSLTDRLDKYKEKLAELLDVNKDELGFTFGDMGIDYLTVDEAHEFKNLEYTTTSQRVVGMNNPVGSQKALDLFLKVRHMDRTKGAGVAFLTGTPISNSLVEVYTFMKYMAWEGLKQMGLQSYDAWAASFAHVETRLEYTATQQLKERNVLAGMINLGALTPLYLDFADVAMRAKVEEMYAEQIRELNAKNGTNLSERFPTPRVKGGARRLLTAAATTDQELYTDYLVARMRAVHDQRRNKEYAATDNSLWVLSDARKVSIDIRTADPLAKRDPNSKVVRIGNEVLRLYRQWNAQKGAQIVFSDQSVPSKTAVSNGRKLIADYAEKLLGEKAGKAQAKLWASQDRGFSWQWASLVEMQEKMTLDDAIEADRLDRLEQFHAANEDAEAVMLTADTGFSFYDDLRAYLVENGMPEREVAFIHDYNSSADKAKLFAKVNAGEVRVLLGSTPKLGAGTNAQERLVGLHHADAPWKPAEIEQREGRIIRQGNKLYEADPDGFEVEILAYSTEGTSDVVLWTVLERKARAIEQFLDGTLDAVSEEGGDASSYAEFMAQSTGNPVFRLNMQYEKALEAESARTSGLLRTQDGARSTLARYPREKADRESILAILSKLEVQELSHYGQRGASAAEFRQLWEAEQEAWQKAYDAALQKVADVTAQREKLKAAGVEDKKLPPIPSVPSRPRLTTPALQQKAKWLQIAAQTAKALGKFDNATVQLSLGDGLRFIARRRVAFGDPFIVGELQYQKNGSWFALDQDTTKADDFSDSERIMELLAPWSIDRAIEGAIRHNQEALSKLERSKTASEEALAKTHDTSERDRLAELSAFYSLAEKVASEAEMRKRLAKENRFILNDRKRRQFLQGGTAQELPANPIRTFDVDGETYTTTGQETATDGSLFGVFEAHRDRDGRLAYINAQRENPTGPFSTSARGVKIAPDAVADELPGGIFKAKVKEMRGFRGVNRPVEGPDDATIMRLQKALNAELAKLGLGRFSVRAMRNIGRVLGVSVNPAGLYVKGTKHIFIRAGARVGEIGVLHHEIMHALRDAELWGKPYGLFTDAEWRALVAAAKRDTAIRTRIEKLYGDLDYSEQVEEMVCELFREWMEKRSETGLVHRALQKVADFFAAIASVLRGEGLLTSAAVMEQIARGDFGRRTDSVPNSVDTELQGSMRENIVTAQMREAPDPITDTQAHSLVDRLLTQAMSGNVSLLALVPGRALFTELGGRLMGGRSYQRFKEEMDAFRDEWHFRADRLAQDWRKLIAKDGEANKRLMDLMHDATVWGQDPQKPFHRQAGKRDWDLAKSGNPDDPRVQLARHKVAEDKKRWAVFQDLLKRYDALPSAFKDMYTEVKGAYQALADGHEQAVIDNIAKATSINKRRAQRAYEDELRRIDDEGLIGGERQEALRKADQALARAKNRADWQAGARASQLRAIFESNRLSGPYFPLTRYGEFFATVRDEHGKVVEFATFERVKERDAFVRAQAGDAGLKIEVGVLAQANLKRMVDPGFVAEVESILGDAAVPKDVMDQIWQNWLKRMPELSVRRNRIHRKGTKGYSEDAFRNFGRHMFHGAHQLARLKYGMEMQDALEEAEREAKRSRTPTRDGLIVAEMVRRHDYTMNPKGAAWAAMANGMAYVYYLAASPAAAAVNLTQTTIMGIPILSTLKKGPGGVVQAAGQLNRAMLDFARGFGHAAESKRLTFEEKAALTEAYRRGTIDKSQAHDLAGIADAGMNYSSRRAKVMGAISWLFHHAERMNREITFLAAFRMAKLNGITDYMDAVDKAAELTWKTHFDYQNNSRPRFMQNDYAHAALAMKNFQINALWRLFRDTYQIVKGEDAETRQEARKQLFGITAMMALHAGISGTWVIGTALWLASFIFGGDDDELKEELKGAIVDTLGAQVGGALWYGLPGYITGTALTNRIGMPDLWFRSPDEPLEGKEEYQFYLSQLVGAVPGMVENLFVGAKKWRDAGTAQEKMRAVEGMTPVAVRNLLKAYRYTMEGLTTAKGDPILDEMPTADILKQALGFTPAEVAEAYELNSRLYSEQTKVLDRRSDLMRRAAKAAMAGEPITLDLQGDIVEFNRAYPGKAISPVDIANSARQRAKIMARSVGGAAIDPKLDAQLRSERAPTVFIDKQP